MNSFLQKLFKKKPPAMMFGKRLAVVENPKVPIDHILLCIHPDGAKDVADKINKAFAEWKSKNV